MALTLLSRILMKKDSTKPNETPATLAQLNFTRTEIVSKIEALDKKTERRFVELEAKIDTRFIQLEAKFESRFLKLEEDMASMKAIMNRVLFLVEEQRLQFKTYNDSFAQIEARLNRLESKH